MLVDNLMWYLRVGSIFGILPFYNKRTKKFLSITPIPIVVLVVVITAQAFDTFDSFSTIGLSKIMWVQVALQPICDISLILQTVITLNFTLRDSLQVLMDTFDIIDQELQTVSGRAVHHPKSSNVIKCFILSSIVFCFFQSLDYILFGITYSVIELIVFHLGDALCFYILQINETFKIILVAAIWKRMKLLNLTMSDVLIESNPHKIAMQFDSVFFIQCKIGDVIDAYNTTYGWNLLISIVQTLIYVLRFCILLLNRDESNEIVASLYFLSIWMTYAIVQTVIIAIICEKVTEEGVKTVNLAYTALHRYSNVAIMREKIYSLAQQTSAKFPCISAAGFFNVNISMLFLFVNLTTTYIIVIVQFSDNRK